MNRILFFMIVFILGCPYIRNGSWMATFLPRAADESVSVLPDFFMSLIIVLHVLICRYEKIILGKVNYPDMFSKPLEDIVSKLLVNNPSKRLGNMKGGLADVMKHKWFVWFVRLARSDGGNT